MTFVLPALSIPCVVPFPGHVVHLHIFEPRYRRLVQDVIQSASHESLLFQGVRKLVTPRRSAWGSITDVLSSNGALYEPAAVGGRGRLSVCKKFGDGRFLVSIEVLERVELIREQCQVPYPRLLCQPRKDPDLTETAEVQAFLQLKKEIVEAALKLLAAQERSNSRGEPGRWLRLEPERFCFEVLKCFTLEKTEAQKLLEDFDPIRRSSCLLGWLQESLVAADTRETAADKDLEPSLSPPQPAQKESDNVVVFPGRFRLPPLAPS